MKNKTEYINAGGVFCPYCNCTDIEGGPVEIHKGTATQEVTCTRCDGEWQDRYTLSDVIRTAGILCPKCRHIMRATSEERSAYECENCGHRIGKGGAG